HGFRHQPLDRLRDDADIGLAAAEIAEAVVAETVGEMTQQDDVVLQFDVGAPSTAAATTEATTTAAAEAAATSASEATPSTRHCHTAARAHARHACPAAGGLRGGSPARRHIHCPAATAAAISARGAAAAIGSRLGRLGAISAAGFGAIATPFGTVRRARPIAATIPDAIATAVPCPIADAITRTIASAIGAWPILSRTKHLLPVTAAEIHPVGSASLYVVVTEALLNVDVVVSHALAMRSVVLPAIPDVRRPVEVVDVEVAVAPVESAAPVIAP